MPKNDLYIAPKRGRPVKDIFERDRRAIWWGVSVIFGLGCWGLVYWWLK